MKHLQRRVDAVGNERAGFRARLITGLRRGQVVRCLLTNDPGELHDRLRDGRVRLSHLLALAFPTAVPSNKEGRRKIVQGGVRLDGEVVGDPDLEVTPADVDGKTLQLGKRNWVRLRG